ncbi:MAG: hypothetical protein UW16_C0014G0024 [Microgenomates group bacterium GW2011_GWC1_44_10]|nr:MAG: hypothetical protein UW16_C0014G0024 [Microgenomates group bacterium GW2011_GWC1_44_10]
MKIFGVLFVMLGLVLGLIKRVFLTERGGVRTMQRLSPAKVFWQEKFPANEIAGICLILGFLLLLLP